MARPSRIEIAGGRYHVAARGNERREIVRVDADRGLFLGLLSELPERFGALIHAYVLMPKSFSSSSGDARSQSQSERPVA